MAERAERTAAERLDELLEKTSRTFALSIRSRRWTASPVS
jgi:hypothetical protein